MPQPDTCPPVDVSNFRAGHAASSLILALAIVLAGAASALILRSLEEQRAQLEFTQLADNVAYSFQRELDTYSELVRTIEGFFNATENVTRPMFSAFCLGAATGLHSIQAMDFVPRVPHAQRAAFEERIRAEGLPDFAITERSPEGAVIPAGVRDFYYPVTYVEPQEPNRAALGFDLGSSRVRAEALFRALRTGQTTTSGRVPLAIDKANTNGVLVFIPIFTRNAPQDTPEQREAALKGFAVGVYRTADLMLPTLAHFPLAGVHVTLLDATRTEQPEEIFSQGGAVPPCRDTAAFNLACLEKTLPIAMPGREWRLRLHAGPQYLAAYATLRPWYALGASVAIALLWLYTASRNRKLLTLAQAHAEERAATALLLGQQLDKAAQAEQQTRENEERLRVILSGIRAATFTLSPDGFAILHMNEVAEELFDIRHADWIGRNYRDLLGRNLRTLDDSGPMNPGGQDRPTMASGEFVLQRPDGRLIPVARTILSTTVGARRYIFEVLFDISEKKALERRLGLAQKLESIGQLASGIAHEINTPIQYIGGNLGFLQDACASISAVLERYRACAGALAALAPQSQELSALRSEMEKYQFDDLLAELPGSIADSISGVERVAAIVGAMKRFSHPDAGGGRFVDVNKAIESTLTITRNEWKYTAEMRAELAPDLPLVFCSPGDFNQVILNIVVNAAHAVAEKQQGRQDKGLITVRTESEPGYVHISIADSGVGIPPENMQRIFDPFFTTKEVGKGTGQGLAIVHAVVERHGGSLCVDSTLGQGTTFHIRFPQGQEGEE
ncbi:CHASE domain-containing protein [Fundidesulfovibrio soli]|uniref:CHASE domain-containing protein n=1 Tax=Fundidesulfovibrio soli TaxID=2922716 RepID=UPI001FAFD8EC|nr:CHASE domain-containing protein [Fundidesulfovibrio soli]